jgi:hypothetical protein
VFKAARALKASKASRVTAPYAIINRKTNKARQNNRKIKARRHKQTALAGPLTAKSRTLLKVSSNLSMASCS